MAHKPWKSPINPAAERAERLDRLESKIRAYNPHCNFNEVKRALAWSEANFKSTSVSTVDDQFSDPLLIVEELVRHAKADHETILAAILYPAARAMGGKGSNQPRLDEIEKLFGYKVRRLVKRTLRFRALNIPQLSSGDEKIDSENIALFRLMGLWAARDPRAILIRATQNVVKLALEVDSPGTHKPDALKKLITDANEVYAQLTYIAGYNGLRNKLMNLTYQLTDPEGYKNTSRIIASAVSKEEGDLIKQTIADEITKKFGWEYGIHFDVEFRAKASASAHVKAERKGQDVTDLGDLWAARVILKMPAIGRPEGTNVDILDEDGRVAAMADFGTTNLSVYGKLSRAFGRANTKTVIRINPITGKKEKYSYIQERLQEIAQIEPRNKDVDRLKDKERFAWEETRYPTIADARFDDYISWPKESGYSAVQDTFWIPLPKHEKPIEIECQIVDEIRHEINTFGPRAGHIYFKTKLGRHTTSVENWFKAVKTEFAGRHYRGHKQVYVLSTTHKRIYDISDNPTVAGFIAAAGLNCQEVRIIDHYDPRPKEHTYGPSTPLPNGCEVVPVKSTL